MSTDTDAPTDPIEAFTELRAEVSLMRRAIEGLTAQREKLPDYTPTLEDMFERIEEVGSWTNEILERPAIKLSPEAFAQEVMKASQTVRAEDGRRLDEARTAMAQAVGRMDGIVERGQAARDQTELQIWSGIAGAMLGMLIWSMLPGMVARTLPESWGVPQWMADRTMRVERQMVVEDQQEPGENASAERRR